MNDSNKKLGQGPAFPKVYDTNGLIGYKEGMSKRFYAACAAMQGILAANPTTNLTEPDSIKKVIEVSYSFADELLKQENNS